MLDTLTEIATGTTGTVGSILAASTIIVGAIAMAIKSPKVKGITLTIGDNKKQCDGHKILVAENEAIKKDLKNTISSVANMQQDVVAVKTNMEWLIDKHKNDSTKETLELIITELKKS